MKHRNLLILSLVRVALSTSSIPIVSRANTSSACRLAARNNVDLSLGFGNDQHCATRTGTLNAFMFFVDFPDQSAPATETPQSLYDFFLPAAAQWYANASYGRLVLNVTADTSKFHRISATAKSYGWERSLTSVAHSRYIQDALVAYQSSGRAVPATDVLYVVATRRATAISFSPTSLETVRTRSGAAVAGACVTVGNDAYTGWGYKLLNHETGHTMCLPDLYPEVGQTGLYVGGWDLMGLISGQSPDYFAWHKWKLGWLDDAQVDCISGAGSSTHTILPLETSTEDHKDVKAVVVKHNSTDVLVAEVRSRKGNDAAACATGVLLYTVSTAIDSGRGPIRVLNANPGSRGCAGDKLNGAVLTLNGTNSYSHPSWGVKVTVMGQTGDSYTVRMDVS